MLVGDVLSRNADVEAEVKLCRGLWFRFSLHFANRLLKHLCVKIEADCLDVAALLASEQIAGAAQFEIERRDLESSSEVREFFQGCQTTAGDRSQFYVRRDQQIRVGPPVRAAHPSAKLIQLR